MNNFGSKKIFLFEQKSNNCLFDNHSTIIIHPDVFITASFYFRPRIKTIRQFQAPQGTHPHDVAVDLTKGGPVWFTAQGTGELGKLDPKTGNKTFIKLGNAPGSPMNGSAPHGIIIGPDGGLWITDEFLKAIVRVDPKTEEIKLFPIPENITNNKLNTATFDKNGVLWFTDRSGYYGKLDPTGERFMSGQHLVDRVLMVW